MFAVFVPIQMFIQVLRTAYVFYFVSFRIDLARRVFNRIGDYSYGIYVYAFPSQQLSYYCLKRYAGVNARPYLLMIVSAALILPVSWTSWHYVKSRMLQLKGLRLPYKNQAERQIQ